MRRPKLTSRRIRGLRAIADRARSVAQGRKGSLFGLPRDEADDVRSAIRFVDDLVKWKERACR